MWLNWQTWVIFLIIGIILIIPLYLFIVPPLDNIGIISAEMSKYYSNKSFNVTFQKVEIKISNATPIIISLTPKIDAFTGGTFDSIYAQCHWSTNYGYFVTINSDYTLIKKYSNEFVIPKCSDSDEHVSWTYDVGDYRKSKPPVVISLKIEDPNKIVKFQKLGDLSNLGGTHLNFVWADTDILQIENNSQNAS
jgi:hypothetical protein